VKKKTQWKEDLYCTVKCARQKLSKLYSEVTPMTGLLLIAVHIFDPVQWVRSFRKWDNGLDINPDGKGMYTTYYQEASLKYVENEHCTKHR
jgi:hypothetical protein